MRILNVPKRGIGAASATKVSVYAEECGIPFFDAACEAEHINGLSSAAAKKIIRFTDLIEKHGLEVLQQTPDGTHIRVTGEEQAKLLLKDLMAEDRDVIKFELREPSLHEIFIEKAGGQHEEK